MCLKQTKNVFVFIFQVFANNEVKLHRFVTILSLITSQGSVHTYIRWSG